MKDRTDYSIIGKKFGELTVLGIHEKGKRVNGNWYTAILECQCDCGNICRKKRTFIVGGHTTNCGCNKYKTGNQSRTWKGFGEISGEHWYTIQYGARKRNIEITVTIEQLWTLFLKQDKKCALSGIELSFSVLRKKQPKQTTASLDRIDSSKGYIEGNVQWIHKDINKMKLDFSQYQFVEYCKLISKNLS